MRLSTDYKICAYSYTKLLTAAENENARGRGQGMRDGCTRSTIQRIAAALGINESALQQQNGDYPNEKLAALSQERELLQLFSSVKDAEKRLACLNFVRALAGPIAED